MFLNQAWTFHIQILNPCDAKDMKEAEMTTNARTQFSRVKDIQKGYHRTALSPFLNSYLRQTGSTSYHLIQLTRNADCSLHNIGFCV